MASYRLPDHCTPTIPFLIRLSSAFNSCVPTSLAFLSTFLGVLSILSWLCAQVPQIYKNYQLGSASGLSIYFLAVWLLGDVTNLLGALLTGQATWQVVVASYYVFVDVALCFQFLWYTHVQPWRRIRFLREDDDSDGEDGSPGDVLVGISPSEESSVTNGTAIENGKTTTKTLHIPKQRQDKHGFRSQNPFAAKENRKTRSGRTILRETRSPSPVASPKTILLVSMLCVVLTNAAPLHTNLAKAPPPESYLELAGRILSWTSTLLYLGSRIPQIYKNAIRHSTAGLSPTLFLAAFCGNLFYSASLATNPLAWSSYAPHGLHGWVGSEGSDKWTWISLAAPFFLGAAGVLLMDATVGLQFYAYRDKLEKSQVLVKDRKGRSKWRTVSGWMRGWIPSPSPITKEEEAVQDDMRPLLSRQGSRSDEYGAA